MTERTPARLHLVLASLGITLLVALVFLLVPGQQLGGTPEEELDAARHERDEAASLRASVFGWLGAGLAVGAAVGGGIGALLVLRKESRRLQEGR